MTTVLRSLLGAIGNAEAVAHDRVEMDGPIGAYAADVGRRELRPADVVRIVEAEIAERRAAVATYEGIGRPDLSATMAAEIGLLSGYLDSDAE